MDSRIFNLNVFTNVASDNPEHCLAHHAIQSFYDAFPNTGDLTVVTRVFIDPKPNPDCFDAWISTIRRALPDLQIEVVQTTGLVKGFAASLERSEGGYAMQLEHDFVFLKSRINHSLPEVLARMQRDKLNYLRFNKRCNEPAAYDYVVQPVSDDEFPICRINGRSNNPHIIELDYYKDVVSPILDGPKGRQIGLEGGLCRFVGGGFLYGGIGYPKTVQHLDGRRIRFKDAIQRNFFLMKQKLNAKRGFRRA